MRNADTSSPSAIRGPAREPARALDPRGRLGLPARATRALQPASRPGLRLRRGRGDHVQGLGPRWWVREIRYFIRLTSFNKLSARSRLYRRISLQINTQIWARFSRSTRCAFLCTAQSLTSVKLFWWFFSVNFAIFEIHVLVKFAIFWTHIDDIFSAKGRESP